jgi:hypothetical protein
MSDTPYNTLECLKKLLQKEVVFLLGQKSVRKGRLLLYNIHDYHVKFMIHTNKNINKTYEVPYPYNVTHSDNHVSFSYTIKDFCRDNANKHDVVMCKYGSSINKFFDKRLTISVIDLQ